MTSLAYLTFVSVDQEGGRLPVAPLVLETDDDRRRAAEADVRRASRLQARRNLDARLGAAS
jgi:hypothetical protein